MKTSYHRWLIAGIAIAIQLIFSSCEKNISEKKISQNGKENLIQGASDEQKITNDEESAESYKIILENTTNNVDGTYTWTWSVQNTNYGNGTDRRIQDLGHLDISLGEFARAEDIVDGSISADSINWITFNPIYRSDPGQNCYAGPVIKFNLGTTGNSKSFYRLKVNKNFSVNNFSRAAFKSGRNTQCGTTTFPGFGEELEEDEGCSSGSDYYYSNPDILWGGPVIVGTYVYTRDEALIIFSTLDRYELGGAKKSFITLSTLELSSNTISSSAPIAADQLIVDRYLSTLGKLSPTNLPDVTTEVRDATNRLSTWLDTHRCSTN